MKLYAIVAILGVIHPRSVAANSHRTHRALGWDDCSTAQKALCLDGNTCQSRDGGDPGFRCAGLAATTLGGVCGGSFTFDGTELECVEDVPCGDTADPESEPCDEDFCCTLGTTQCCNEADAECCEGESCANAAMVACEPPEPLGCTCRPVEVEEEP